jgi:nucleoside-diphosphate-sugar epimerase
LVTGASGFIAAHLVNRLKREGHWVRGVSRSRPPFSPSPADEYLILDLRRRDDCDAAIRTADGVVDDVYHLAADMGGIGYITAADCEVLKNNALININMTDAAATSGVARYFFSSSVCVYRDMRPGEHELQEDDAIPASPDNAYGWEKLFSEQVLATFARRHNMSARIARFQTAYGPQGAWTGGREKAPAALCRKVAEAVDGGTIEVWGDGTAIRSFLYVDDLIDGIVRIMNSGLEGPVNIGSPEYVSVKELVDCIIGISGKTIGVKYVHGPVGVQSRNFSNRRIDSIGWRPTVSLREGLTATYTWIEQQIRNFRAR